MGQVWYRFNMGKSITLNLINIFPFHVLKQIENNNNNNNNNNNHNNKMTPLQ